jgi:hypothetical protein
MIVVVGEESYRLMVGWLMMVVNVDALDDKNG